MANTKEIQSRINSIHDTMKITKAMYMMSSVKLRKARQKLEDTEPYFYGLQDQIKSILYHFPTMQHLFFDNRNSDMHEQIKKKAFIVISGDKGMAGAYNHNVLKEAKRLCDESQEYKIFILYSKDVKAANCLILIGTSLTDKHAREQLGYSSFLLNCSFIYIEGGIPYNSLNVVEKLLGSVNPVNMAISDMVCCFSDNRRAASFKRILRIKSRVVWLVSSLSFL